MKRACNARFRKKISRSEKVQVEGIRIVVHAQRNLRKNPATFRKIGKTIGAASLAKLLKVAQRSHWGDRGASWNSEVFIDVSLAVA